MAAELQVLREHLLKLVQQPGYVPLRKRKLAKKLGVDDKDYVDFRHLVEDMVSEGVLAELKHGKFGLPPRSGDNAAGLRDGGRPAVRSGRKHEVHDPFEHSRKKRPVKNALQGRIEIKRGGFGFLLSDPPGNDVYISQEDLGGAMSGDLVAVIPKRSEHGRRQGRRYISGTGSGQRPSGRVVEILERGHPVVVGTFYLHKAGRYDPPEGPGGFVVPDTRGVFTQIDILPADKSSAQDGDKVEIELLEPEEQLRSGHQPTGKVLKVYGEAGEARAEIAAVIRNFNLREEFPAEALAQAESIPEKISEEELAGRVDYTAPITFTIDPADAKDHDDAVAIRNLGEGRTELLVHIADVAHYVTTESPIDVEARERATSVYLPGQVLPMLPPKLSNNMCSLKEGQIRLTLTCAITFSKNLIPTATRIERSFIRSAAFLTYDRVKQAIDEEDPAQLPSQEIYDTLRQMKGFASALRRKRLEDGSVDLELPEVKLLLDDQGRVTGWEKEAHHWAHQLIEDMMLAANRAIAEYLVEHEIPGLYRIHEDPDPDALERFAEFVREFGISISPPIDRKKMRFALEKVKGKDYQHAVHMALLTSMKQAHYSAECHPHFALNFTRYLHFTSPIRRYPDLVVHRALNARFAPGEKQLPAHGKKRRGGDQGRAHFERVADLRGLAIHTSHRERQAAAAEEEVKKFRQIEYLRSNMRESHPGVITGVKDFGLFVELQDCYVEGLVRIQDLNDDFYEFHEEQHLLQGRRKRRSFRLGDKVTVRVVHIDLGQKRVGMMLV
ncbi:MAG: ribonuclease R [Planctomycetes bacterium]|nr:ribonuclease R [Planctomycetota bacterium]